MPEVIYQGDLPAFTGRNVPIKEIASAIGKDAQYVRLGIQQGLIYKILGEPTAILACQNC